MTSPRKKELLKQHHQRASRGVFPDGLKIRTVKGKMKPKGRHRSESGGAAGKAEQKTKKRVRIEKVLFDHISIFQGEGMEFGTIVCITPQFGIGAISPIM